MSGTLPRGLAAASALTLLLGLPLSGVAGPATSPLPFSPKVETLANGLKLVMVPQPSPGLVAYYSLVGVGSRDEVEPGVTGFAHFFEHMMFRGTDLWSPAKVQEFLKQTGADQNGFTTDDFTCYTFFGSSGHLDELVAYEADRFRNLKYSEDVFKTEAGAVLGEYNKSASSPSLPLREKLRELVFTKHTYGHTTLGYLKDIEAMPTQYEYSKKFFERFYTPDNTMLFVVGDFDPAVLLDLVKKHYGPWKRRRAATKVKAEPPQKKEIRAHLDWPTPTLPVLSMSWRTPAATYGTPDTAVYNIMGEMLFGRVSPVYTELVLEAQKVVSFYDAGWNHKDPYLFHAWVQLKDPADFELVEKRIQTAIDEFASGKVDATLLENVKSNHRFSTLLDLNTPDKIALALAYFAGPTRQPDALQKSLTAVAKVSAKDVQAFAKKYLGAAQRSVITLSEKAPATAAQ
jgi:zinc protease